MHYVTHVVASSIDLIVMVNITIIELIPIMYYATEMIFVNNFDNQFLLFERKALGRTCSTFLININAKYNIATIDFHFIG